MKIMIRYIKYLSRIFNNPLKVYLSNKKYFITIQTPPSIFLSEKLVFNGLLKIIGVQNQLPITFCSDECAIRH